MSNVSDLTKHHEQLQFRFTPQQHVGALTVYHVQYLTLRGLVAVVRQELIIALIDAHFAKEFCGLLAN
jgi:hypothetical protein